jgi:hypothetical protein
VSDLKNSVDGLIRRLATTDERINKFKDISIEIIQMKQTTAKPQEAGCGGT